MQHGNVSDVRRAAIGALTPVSECAISALAGSLLGLIE
jgi:hypothetical protein